MFEFILRSGWSGKLLNCDSSACTENASIRQIIIMAQVHSKFPKSIKINFKTKLRSMNTFRAQWTLSCFYLTLSTGCTACWLHSQSIKMPWWWHFAGTMQVQRLGRGEAEACNVDGQDMSARLLPFSSCNFEIF